MAEAIEPMDIETEADNEHQDTIADKSAAVGSAEKKKGKKSVEVLDSSAVVEGKRQRKSVEFFKPVQPASADKKKAVTSQEVGASSWPGCIPPVGFQQVCLMLLAAIAEL
jgi:hypothetical protein